MGAIYTHTHTLIAFCLGYWERKGDKTEYCLSLVRVRENSTRTCALKRSFPWSRPCNWNPLLRQNLGPRLISQLRGNEPMKLHRVIEVVCFSAFRPGWGQYEGNGFETVLFQASRFLRRLWVAGTHVSELLLDVFTEK